MDYEKSMNNNSGISIISNSSFPVLNLILELKMQKIDSVGFSRFRRNSVPPKGIRILVKREGGTANSQGRSRVPRLPCG
jgi:hypothetical protein